MVVFALGLEQKVGVIDLQRTLPCPGASGSRSARGSAQGWWYLTRRRWGGMQSWSSNAGSMDIGLAECTGPSQ